MNDRPPSINEPGQENLDRNILRNEIHVFLSETGWGIFNRNSGEISSGIDTGGTTTGMLLCYIFLALQTQQRRAWLTLNRSRRVMTSTVGIQRIYSITANRTWLCANSNCPEPND